MVNSVFDPRTPAARDFSDRHIGPRGPQVGTMLAAIGGYDDLTALVNAAVPAEIRTSRPLDLPPRLRAAVDPPRIHHGEVPQEEEPGEGRRERGERDQGQQPAHPNPGPSPPLRRHDRGHGPVSLAGGFDDTAIHSIGPPRPVNPT